MTATLSFPDNFVVTLSDQLRKQMTMPAVPDYPGEGFYRRPLRPDDPNLSVAVFESDMEPVDYEIGGHGHPSLMRWNVNVQVYCKAVDEIDGRATRSKLLQRVRATLFSTATETAVMTLVDAATSERVTKFRLRRIAFASGDGPRTGEMFFLGQVEVFFETEMH